MEGLCLYNPNNGKSIVIKDNTSKTGWKAKNKNDLVNALYEWDIFQTVCRGFLESAIVEACKDNQEFESIREFANYLLKNYI